MIAGDTYLAQIVRDVQARLRAEPSARLDTRSAGATRSLAARIRTANDAGELAVIAEVKRRSPSVGAIALEADPAAQAAAYDSAGVSGISVLTEPDHFGGSLEDLSRARAAAVHAPVLRKDFVIDVAQVHDAYSCGADAVLLIAVLHEQEALLALIDAVHAASMEVLLEVHDERELERALATSADLIGINNRDLRSFEVDLAVTERLAPLVPDDRIVVSESGIRSIDDARRMHRAGVQAILVGEALMRAADPHALARALATAPISREGGMQ